MINPSFRKQLEEILSKSGWCVDDRILDVMGKIPRHRFISHDLETEAYDDHPLPIGYDQTISQPSLVAKMVDLAAIKPNSKVLEIGSGSGYQTAILATLADKVYSLEIVPELAKQAQKTLLDLGFNNAHVLHSDGNLGLKEHAPYQSIIVTAAAPKIPESLLKQLAVGGRMIIPVGEAREVQDLLLIEKTDDDNLTQQSICPVRFVPFVT